jgi:lysozyme family protein
MPGVPFTSRLREEYQRLFDTCVARSEKAREIERTLSRIGQHQSRYASVGDPMGVPWYLVGVIHQMEASLDFSCHLHNGDPLDARTVQVPAGRPRTGEPPFTWESSAADALRTKGLERWSDWSVPGILYTLEGYNGFGYRAHHPEVLSPYLWSYSNLYAAGKYVADGTWSPTAVSRQCGGAVLLRRMAETGTIRFDRTGIPVPALARDAGGEDPLARIEPMIPYSTTKKSPLVEEFQRALNRLPGIYVKVDGIAGPRTSEAFRKVTGHYLAGDPRA